MNESEQKKIPQVANEIWKWAAKGKKFHVCFSLKSLKYMQIVYKCWRCFSLFNALKLYANTCMEVCLSWGLFGFLWFNNSFICLNFWAHLIDSRFEREKLKQQITKIWFIYRWWLCMRFDLKTNKFTQLTISGAKFNLFIYFVAWRNWKFMRCCCRASN